MAIQNFSPSYSIDMHANGNYIINLNIDFKSNMSLAKLTIGHAFLQIVDRNSIPTNFMDFAYSIKNYPIDYIGKLDELITALQIIDTDEIPIQGRFAVLHYLTLFKENRGKKLSEVFIRLILQGLKENFNINYVILQPCPTEIDKMDVSAMKQEIERLSSLYKKVGFQVIKERRLTTSHGLEVNYLYMDLSKI